MNPSKEIKLNRYYLDPTSSDTPEVKGTSEKQALDAEELLKEAEEQAGIDEVSGPISINLG